MINHARTLLMNIEGSSQFHFEYGEEIIPADYRVRTLPQSLINIRKILFGQNPDRAMLNYRCRQLLALIHRSDLEQYITALDSRITYGFSDNPYFDDNIFRPTVVQYESLAGNPDLTVVGTAEPPDKTGRMRQEFLVYSDTSNACTVTRLNPHWQQEVAVTYESGLSNLIALPGSGLYVRKRDTSTDPLQYRVTSYARPATDLGDLAASLATVGAETLANMFLTGTSLGGSEPFKTFRNLWESHNQLPYKLGGLLLALIYHTDTL